MVEFRARARMKRPRATDGMLVKYACHMRIDSRASADEIQRLSTDSPS